MKTFKNLLRNEWLWLMLIILIAAFLYFYKINQWHYLNYDQARDYLIIKRILVNHKLTLIGPSLGILDGGYQPPFYYYLLAPSFLVSSFHIWGPNALSALIGLAGLIVFYFVARDLFGKVPALASSLIYALNPYMIQAARHTRNPHWLPLFVLLLLFSFKKYLFEKRDKYLLLASISLAVAISLHITAAIFLPFWFYLLYQELRQSKISRRLIASLAGFSAFFAPLALFVFRHDFLMLKAAFGFFTQKGDFSFWQVFLKTGRFFQFLVKIPLVFFSGIYQKELLSLRSLPLAPLEKISLLEVSGFDLFKLILSVGLLVLMTFVLIINLKKKKSDLYKTLTSFVLAGLAVGFMCPPNGSFLYYFYNLFPFLLLLVAGSVAWLIQKASFFKKTFILLFFVPIAVIPLFPHGLKTETRPESYFIPASESIAKDFELGKKIAVAVNAKESARWEKNALEYRYFLESIYKLPLGNWDANGYAQADVLYLVDEEGSVKPLTLGGMEMESFNPKEIDKLWTVETGQKIYKLLK